MIMEFVQEKYAGDIDTAAALVVESGIIVEVLGESYVKFMEDIFANTETYYMCYMYQCCWHLVLVAKRLN